MSVAVASPEPEAAPDQQGQAGQPGQESQRAQDRLYYRRLLHDLLETGAGVNRMIQRHTQDEEGAAGDPPLPGEAPAPASAPALAPVRVKDTVAAYDQLTCSMRRSIMLADKLAEPVRAANPATRQRIAARRRIIREVEDVIQRNTEDEDAAEALHGELLDRLDSPELEDEIGDRPVGEIIADICRDLGLAHPPGSHPWKRRRPGDIAALAARAAQAPAPVRPAPAAAPVGQAPVVLAAVAQAPVDEAPGPSTRIGEPPASRATQPPPPPAPVPPGARQPPPHKPPPPTPSCNADDPSPRAPPGCDPPERDLPVLMPVGPPATAPPAYACSTCRQWRWQWRAHTRLGTTGWFCGPCHRV